MQPGVTIQSEMSALPIGKAQLRRTGKKVAILSFGTMLAAAEAAGEKLDATVVNMRFVKPLDVEMILRLADEHTLLVTVEENVIQGGAGSAVAECLSQHHKVVSLLQLGLPDRFIEQGDPVQLLADCGLDAAGLVQSITRAM